MLTNIQKIVTDNIPFCKDNIFNQTNKEKSGSETSESGTSERINRVNDKNKDKNGKDNIINIDFDTLDIVNQTDIDNYVKLILHPWILIFQIII